MGFYKVFLRSMKQWKQICWINLYLITIDWIVAAIKVTTLNNTIQKLINSCGNFITNWLLKVASKKKNWFYWSLELNCINQIRYNCNPKVAVSDMDTIAISFIHWICCRLITISIQSHQFIAAQLSVTKFTYLFFCHTLNWTKKKKKKFFTLIF